MSSRQGRSMAPLPSGPYRQRSRDYADPSPRYAQPLPRDVYMPSSRDPYQGDMPQRRSMQYDGRRGYPVDDYRPRERGQPGRSSFDDRRPPNQPSRSSYDDQRRSRPASSSRGAPPMALPMSARGRESPVDVSYEMRERERERAARSRNRNTQRQQIMVPMAMPLSANAAALEDVPSPPTIPPPPPVELQNWDYLRAGNVRAAQQLASPPQYDERQRESPEEKTSPTTTTNKLKRKPAPAYVPTPMQSRHGSAMDLTRERQSVTSMPAATPPRVRDEVTRQGYRSIIPQQLPETPRTDRTAPLGSGLGSPIRSPVVPNNIELSPASSRPPLPRYQSGSGRIRAGEDLPVAASQQTSSNRDQSSVSGSRPPTPPGLSPARPLVDLPRRSMAKAPSESSLHRVLAMSSAPRPRRASDAQKIKSSAVEPPATRKESSSAASPSAASSALPPSATSNDLQKVSSVSSNEPKPGLASRPRNKTGSEGLLFGAATADLELPLRSRSKARGGDEDKSKSTESAAKPMSKTSSKDRRVASTDRLAVPEVVTSDSQLSSSSGDGARPTKTKHSNTSKTSVSKSVGFAERERRRASDASEREAASERRDKDETDREPGGAPASRRRGAAANDRPVLAPPLSLAPLNEDAPQINPRRSSKMPPEPNATLPAVPGLAPEPRRAYERKPRPDVTEEPLVAAPLPQRPVQPKRMESGQSASASSTGEKKERPMSRFFGFFGGSGGGGAEKVKVPKPKREILPDGRVVTIAAPAPPSPALVHAAPQAKDDDRASLIMPAAVSKRAPVPIESSSSEADSLPRQSSDSPRTAVPNSRSASTIRLNKDDDPSTRAPLNLETMGLDRFGSMRRPSNLSVASSELSSANEAPLLSDFSDSRSAARRDTPVDSERETKSRSSIWPMAFSSLGRSSGANKHGRGASTSSLPPPVANKDVERRASTVEADPQQIKSAQASVAPSIVTSDEMPNAFKLPGMPSTSILAASKLNANEAAAEESSSEAEQQPPRPPSRAMTDTTDDHFTDIETDRSDVEDEGEEEEGGAVTTEAHPASGTQTPKASTSQVNVSTRQSPAETSRPTSALIPASVSGLLNWFTGSQQPAAAAATQTPTPTPTPTEDAASSSDAPTQSSETEPTTVPSEAAESEVEPATPRAARAVATTSAPPAVVVETASESEATGNDENEEEDDDDDESVPSRSPPPSFAAAMRASPRKSRSVRSGEGRRPRRRSRSSISSNSTGGGRRRRRGAAAAGSSRPARPTVATTRQPSETMAAPETTRKSPIDKKRMMWALPVFRKKKAKPAAAEATSPPTSPTVASPTSASARSIPPTAAAASPASPTEATPPEETAAPAPASPRSPRKRLSFFGRKRDDGKGKQAGTTTEEETTSPAAEKPPAQPSPPRPPSRVSLAVNGALHRSLSTALVVVDKLSGVDENATRSQPSPSDGKTRRVTFSHAEEVPDQDNVDAPKQKKPLGPLLYGKVLVQNDDILRMRGEGPYWQQNNGSSPARSALKAPSSASLPQRSTTTLPSTAGPSTERITSRASTRDADSETIGRSSVATARPYYSGATSNKPVSDYGKARSSGKASSKAASPVVPATAKAPSSPSLVSRTTSYLKLGGNKGSPKTEEATV